MTSLVDRLLELSKVDDFMSAINRKEIESIKKQLEENEKIVERLKLKIGQYHGKTNYEDYDELLQSILGECPK